MPMPVGLTLKNHQQLLNPLMTKKKWWKKPEEPEEDDEEELGVYLLLNGIVRC